MSRRHGQDVQPDPHGRLAGPSRGAAPTAKAPAPPADGRGPRVDGPALRVDGPVLRVDGPVLRPAGPVPRAGAPARAGTVTGSTTHGRATEPKAPATERRSPQVAP